MSQDFVEHIFEPFERERAVSDLGAAYRRRFPHDKRQQRRCKAPDVWREYPLAAIVGFTSLAITHINQREQVQEYLKKIMTSGNHLLSLINDILDMSRICAGVFDGITEQI